MTFRDARACVRTAYQLSAYARGERSGDYGSRMPPGVRGWSSLRDAASSVQRYLSADAWRAILRATTYPPSHPASRRYRFHYDH